MSKLSAKYAKALYASSVEDTRDFEAHALSEIGKEVKDSAHFFKNPFISLDKKKDVLEKILGKEAPPRLIRFLELLIKNKRFGDLPSISFEFQELVNESQGTMDALMVVPEALDEETLELFKTKLESHFNKKMKITQKIDPALLGGFTLIAAGKIIDLSIKGKLASIKERLHSQKV